MLAPALVCFAVCYLCAGVIGGWSVGYVAATTTPALITPAELLPDADGTRAVRTLTLKSVYVTAFTPCLQEVVFACVVGDTPWDGTYEGVVGVASMVANTNPLYVDMTAEVELSDYSVAGTFSGCDQIGLGATESGYEFVIDNMDITVEGGDGGGCETCTESRQPAKLDLSTIP